MDKKKKDATFTLDQRGIIDVVNEVCTSKIDSPVERAPGHLGDLPKRAMASAVDVEGFWTAEGAKPSAKVEFDDVLKRKAKHAELSYCD